MKMRVLWMARLDIEIIVLWIIRTRMYDKYEFHMEDQRNTRLVIISSIQQYSMRCTGIDVIHFLCTKLQMRIHGCIDKTLNLDHDET